MEGITNMCLTKVLKTRKPSNKDAIFTYASTGYQWLRKFISQSGYTIYTAIFGYDKGIYTINEVTRASNKLLRSYDDDQEYSAGFHFFPKKEEAIVMAQNQLRFSTHNPEDFVLCQAKYRDIHTEGLQRMDYNTDEVLAVNVAQYRYIKAEEGDWNDIFQH